MTARLVECPNGHPVKPIPVLYGYPSPKAMADADAGKVRLGGCDPTFEDDRVGDCPTCNAPIPAAAPATTRTALERQEDGRPDPPLVR